MKFLVPCLGALFLAAGSSPRPHQSERNQQPRFSTSGSIVKPSITGPEGVTPLVHVVEQPDSPLEILAIDFKDSFLSIVNERETEQLRCTVSAAHT